MIQTFNELQKIFGRPLILVDVDIDSLVFRLPWWGSKGKEFEIGNWDMQVLERTTNTAVERNDACIWIEQLLQGYVRNEEGELRPREHGQ